MEESTESSEIQTPIGEGKIENASADLYSILKAEQKNLSDQEIIERYFELERQLEPNYMEKVESLSREIGGLPPGCELSIVIPAYREETNIRKTLEELRNKISLPENMYEVILVVNYPEGAAPDRTREIAEAFKMEQGWANLHILEVQFPKEISNVGSARKLGSDIALFRYQQRMKNFPNDNVFYIAGTDADVLEIAEDHYPKMLEELKSNQLEVIAGLPRAMVTSESLPPNFYETRPNLFILSKVLSTFSSEAEKAKGFSVVGQDFALRASAYARIGGIPRLIAGEDTSISDRAVELNLKHGILENNRIVTSPRRMLIGLKDFFMGEAWSTEKFPTLTEKIRDLEQQFTIGELIERIPDITKEELAEFIKSQLVVSAAQLSQKKNQYLDLSLEEVIGLLKEILGREKIGLPFDIDEAKDEIYSALVKRTYYELVQRPDLIREKKEYARRDLEAAGQKLKASEDIIAGQGKTEEASMRLSLVNLEEKEARLRLKILDLLEGTSKDRFEEMYKGLEGMEEERKKLEDQIRDLRSRLKVATK